MQYFNIYGIDTKKWKSLVETWSNVYFETTNYKLEKIYHITTSDMRIIYIYFFITQDSNPKNRMGTDGCLLRKHIWFRHHLGFVSLLQNKQQSTRVSQSKMYNNIRLKTMLYVRCISWRYTFIIHRNNRSKKIYLCFSITRVMLVTACIAWYETPTSYVVHCTLTCL